MTGINKPDWLRNLRSYVFVFDPFLLLIILLLVTIGLIALYSAGLQFPGRAQDQVRNLGIAFLVLWASATLSPFILQRCAVPVYLMGIVLLVAVAFFGILKNGSRRWLNLGMSIIQPSEIMKIAMPLMLAWYFQQREESLFWGDYLVGLILIALPVMLILKQPDLGTALLVFSAGFYVLFFAGLSWRVLLGTLIIAFVSLPFIWKLGLHPYQRERIMTLLDPTADPLGKGFHTIQAMIAVGSGGTFGKGWLKGTQSHLEFIPERTTDFIFAVFSEEFGWVGNSVLLLLYTLFVARGLTIAANASTLFCRLLAGAVTLIFFTYAFVNMGMVTGILPVVGVPLPLISYGGTALVTLGFGAGILMSIHRSSQH